MNSVYNNKTNLSLEKAKTLFGKRLRDARKRNEMTQEDLASKFKLTRVVIANWEKGSNSPEPEKAVLLAKILMEDPVEFFLLSNLQKAASNPTMSEETIKIVEEMIKIVENLLYTYKKDSKADFSIQSHQTHKSLIDFPEAFSPITVICGDKREEEPQNAGDLFVFSASTVDDRWLSSLRLPSDTEKISDKVFMTSYKDQAWLKKKLGKRHILCIGSPASNLFAREYNDHFLFRFAISREAISKWKIKRESMLKLETPAAFSLFYHENKPDLKHIMRLFKPPGFIDFNYRNLRLGMDVGYSMDFAVISLGQNPFAETDDPFFSILVAGIHHPATANAVKFLAKATNFKKHPFGGILEVQVPSKKVPLDTIHWHNKIENCSIDWHKAGEDPLEYEPQDLLKKLQEQWKIKVKNDEIIIDVPIKEEEIDRHINLINLLEKKNHYSQNECKLPSADVLLESSKNSNKIPQ